ncbi:uncharacterized protein VNE69_03057 [Vairimorpha necatrix]|uniref:Uncharacterized protein n=1 Tax=Vairimorpha necatrix TaxID=6039 RepID=A0AAX4JAB3_9MICR
MQLLCLTNLISYLNASDSSNISNQNNIYPVESFLEIIPQTSSERYIKGSNSLLQNVGENKDTSLELVDNHFDSSEEEFITLNEPLELTEENLRFLELELDELSHPKTELTDDNPNIYEESLSGSLNIPSGEKYEQIDTKEDGKNEFIYESVELSEENLKLLEKELDQKIEAFLELEDNNLEINIKEFEDNPVKSEEAFAESRDLPLEITSENLKLLEIELDELKHTSFVSENKLSDMQSTIKAENNFESVDIDEKQDSRCSKHISFGMGVFAACAVVGYAFLKGYN